MRKWLDKLTKLQYVMLATSLFFIWFCICYCVNWAVGNDPESPKSPSPNDIITFVTLPLTVVAIFYAKKAFEHQQVLGAWSLLAQKGTGDLGRKDALEFLHSKGKFLAGLDLSNAHLDDLKLKEDLDKLIPKADLTNAVFKGASLNRAHFEGAILVGTHFEGAELWWMHFDGANLDCAHFEGASLCGAPFKDAKLNESHFDGASLCGVHFKGIELNESHFEGAELDCAHFEGAHLDGACFESAQLTHAKFCGALFSRRTIFKNCYIWWNKECSLPTAPEGWKFEFEKKNGKQRIGVTWKGGNWETRYYIKLIKTETKNP